MVQAERWREQERDAEGEREGESERERSPGDWLLKSPTSECVLLSARRWGKKGLTRTSRKARDRSGRRREKGGAPGDSSGRRRESGGTPGEGAVKSGRPRSRRDSKAKSQGKNLPQDGEGVRRGTTSLAKTGGTRGATRRATSVATMKTARGATRGVAHTNAEIARERPGTGYTVGRARVVAPAVAGGSVGKGCGAGYTRGRPREADGSPTVAGSVGEEEAGYTGGGLRGTGERGRGGDSATGDDDVSWDVAEEDAVTGEGDVTPCMGSPINASFLVEEPACVPVSSLRAAPLPAARAPMTSCRPLVTPWKPLVTSPTDPFLSSTPSSHSQASVSDSPSSAFGTLRASEASFGSGLARHRKPSCASSRALRASLTDPVHRTPAPSTTVQATLTDPFQRTPAPLNHSPAFRTSLTDPVHRAPAPSPAFQTSLTDPVHRSGGKNSAQSAGSLRFSPRVSTGRGREVKASEKFPEQLQLHLQQGTLQAQAKARPQQGTPRTQGEGKPQLLLMAVPSPPREGGRQGPPRSLVWSDLTSPTSCALHVIMCEGGVSAQVGDKGDVSSGRDGLGAAAEGPAADVDSGAGAVTRTVQGVARGPSGKRASSKGSSGKGTSAKATIGNGAKERSGRESSDSGAPSAHSYAAVWAVPLSPGAQGEPEPELPVMLQRAEGFKVVTSCSRSRSEVPWSASSTGTSSTGPPSSTSSGTSSTGPSSTGPPSSAPSSTVPSTTGSSSAGPSGAEPLSSASSSAPSSAQSAFPSLPCRFSPPRAKLSWARAPAGPRPWGAYRYSTQWCAPGRLGVNPGAGAACDFARGAPGAPLVHQHSLPPAGYTSTPPSAVHRHTAGLVTESAPLLRGALADVADATSASRSHARSDARSGARASLAGRERRSPAGELSRKASLGKAPIGMGDFTEELSVLKRGGSLGSKQANSVGPLDREDMSAAHEPRVLRRGDSVGTKLPMCTAKEVAELFPQLLTCKSTWHVDDYQDHRLEHQQHLLPLRLHDQQHQQHLQHQLHQQHPQHQLHQQHPLQLQLPAFTHQLQRLHQQQSQSYQQQPQSYQQQQQPQVLLSYHHQHQRKQHPEGSQRQRHPQHEHQRTPQNQQQQPQRLGRQVTWHVDDYGEHQRALQQPQHQRLERRQHDRNHQRPQRQRRQVTWHVDEYGLVLPVEQPYQQQTQSRQPLTFLQPQQPQQYGLVHPVEQPQQYGLVHPVEQPQQYGLVHPVEQPNQRQPHGKRPLPVLLPQLQIHQHQHHLQHAQRMFQVYMQQQSGRSPKQPHVHQHQHPHQSQKQQHQDHHQQ